MAGNRSGEEREGLSLGGELAASHQTGGELKSRRRRTLRSLGLHELDRSRVLPHVNGVGNEPLGVEGRHGGRNGGSTGGRLVRQGIVDVSLEGVALEPKTLASLLEILGADRSDEVAGAELTPLGPKDRGGGRGQGGDGSSGGHSERELQAVGPCRPVSIETE